MSKGDLKILSVTVNACVRKTGQYPESIMITLKPGSKTTAVSADDFSMTGICGMWGTTDTREFSCAFSSALLSGDTLTLIPKDFPVKYFFVKSFRVSCSSDPELSFDSEMVVDTITPVADEFTYHSDGALNYHFYTPANQMNMPVVISFHGFADTHTLLTYRTSIIWAEPDNQESRPCYIIAPVIEDKAYFTVEGRDEVFTRLKELLDRMIAEGKVDPHKIYLNGISFGGMSAIEFAEKYPEFPAGILALCPALTYSEGAVANIDKIRDIPLWIAHSTGDSTIPVTSSRDAVARLKEIGAQNVQLTEYSDEELIAAGGDPDPDATYSFHHVDLAALEDDRYLSWLFSQKRY